MMKNIVPNNVEEMSGNSICPGTPGKHPGNIRERCSYQCFELKEQFFSSNLTLLKIPTAFAKEIVF